MDIRMLFEKKLKAEDNARALLSKENYSREDDKKADELMEEARNAAKQIEKIKELEGEEEKEVRKEMKGNTEAEEWKNHDGSATAEVYRKGVDFYVPDPKHDIRLGRFLQIATVGGKTEAERRVLAESSDNTGGVTTPDFLFKEFIDLARDKTQIMKAGARTVNLKSDSNTIAKMTSGLTLDYYSENSEISTSDPAFTGVDFVPKKAAVITKVSRELMEDSINIQEMLENEFVQNFAKEIDRVALIGDSGSDEPDGILNFSDLALAYSLGTNGSNFYTGPSTGTTSTGSSAYWPFLAVVSAIMQNNHTPNAAIMNPREWVELNDLIDTTEQPLQKPELIKNLSFLDTGIIPVTDTVGTSTNTSKIYLGDFEKLLIGIRNGLYLKVLQERYADYDQVGYLGAMRFDVQATHENAFGYISGVYPRGGAMT